MSGMADVEANLLLFELLACWRGPTTHARIGYRMGENTHVNILNSYNANKTTASHIMPTLMIHVII